jgi:hypothetical protein
LNSALQERVSAIGPDAEGVLNAETAAVRVKQDAVLGHIESTSRQLEAVVKDIACVSSLCSFFFFFFNAVVFLL